MKTDIDDWFALPDKIDMIPNDETAKGLREIYMAIEAKRLRGMTDCSNEQCYLKNTIDFFLSKYKDNTNNGDNK